MDLGTAQVAAVLGAIGVVLLLAVPRRWAAIAGLALLAARGGRPRRLARGGRAARRAGRGRRSAQSPASPSRRRRRVFVRRPALVTPLVLAAAPFRLPLDFDREHRFYVAVGGERAARPVAAALRRARRRGDGSALAPAARRPRAAACRARRLGAGRVPRVGVRCRSLWTDDLRAAENLLAYFLLPFAVLVAVVAAAPFPPWMPRVLAWIAVALGLRVRGGRPRAGGDRRGCSSTRRTSRSRTRTRTTSASRRSSATRACTAAISCSRSRSRSSPSGCAGRASCSRRRAIACCGPRSTSRTRSRASPRCSS